jgi:hypothetical protein
MKRVRNVLLAKHLQSGYRVWFAGLWELFFSINVLHFHPKRGHKKRMESSLLEGYAINIPMAGQSEFASSSSDSESSTGSD